MAILVTQLALSFYCRCLQSPPESTRHVAPRSAYENALGDALERVFEGGTTTLDEVVSALNAQNFRTADGHARSAERYEAELARLGA